MARVIACHVFFGVDSRRFTGLHFCVPGDCVGTIDLDEAAIRGYVSNQGKFETHKQTESGLPEFK